MKKLGLFLLAVILFITSYSQVQFGIKSGINIATTRDLITFPKNRLGWYGGGLAIIQLHKKLFLQPELNFSSKGYRYIDQSTNRTVAMRLNYLSIPIQLSYNIDKKTNLLFGTELGYLIKAVNDFNNENANATASFPKKLDIGLAIGLQYDIIKRLGVEARYIYGFKRFYQTDAVGVRRSELLAANRAFQLGLYYILSK